jgi:hypothetical protein
MLRACFKHNSFKHVLEEYGVACNLGVGDQPWRWCDENEC